MGRLALDGGDGGGGDRGLLRGVREAEVGEQGDGEDGEDEVHGVSPGTGEPLARFVRLSLCLQGTERATRTEIPRSRMPRMHNSGE